MEECYLSCVMLCCLSVRAWTHNARTNTTTHYHCTRDSVLAARQLENRLSLRRETDTVISTRPLSTDNSAAQRTVKTAAHRNTLTSVGTGAKNDCLPTCSHDSTTVLSVCLCPSPVRVNHSADTVFQVRARWSMDVDTTCIYLPFGYNNIFLSWNENI